MPLSLPELIGYVSHLRCGLERRLGCRKIDQYVEQYRGKGIVLDVVPSSKKEEQSKVCPICGYAMVYLSLNSGWLLETCSATGLEQRFINDSQYRQWCKDLE